MIKMKHSCDNMYFEKSLKIIICIMVTFLVSACSLSGSESPTNTDVENSVKDDTFTQYFNDDNNLPICSVDENAGIRTYIDLTTAVRERNKIKVNIVGVKADNSIAYTTAYEFVELAPENKVYVYSEDHKNDAEFLINDMDNWKFGNPDNDIVIKLAYKAAMKLPDTFNYDNCPIAELEGITYCDSKEKVLEVLGQPLEVRDNNVKSMYDFPTEGLSYQNIDVLINTNTNKVFLIYTKNDSAGLPEGIKIGDSKQKLLDAYGEPVLISDGGQGWWYIGKGNVPMEFGIYNDKIIKILIGSE